MKNAFTDIQGSRSLTKQEVAATKRISKRFGFFRHNAMVDGGETFMRVWPVAPQLYEYHSDVSVKHPVTGELMEGNFWCTGNFCPACIARIKKKKSIFMIIEEFKFNEKGEFVPVRNEPVLIDFKTIRDTRVNREYNTGYDSFKDLVNSIEGGDIDVLTNPETGLMIKATAVAAGHGDFAYKTLEFSWPLVQAPTPINANWKSIIDYKDKLDDSYCIRLSGEDLKLVVDGMKDVTNPQVKIVETLLAGLKSEKLKEMINNFTKEKEVKAKSAHPVNNNSHDDKKGFGRL